MHHKWFKAFYQTFEIDIKLPLNCTGFLESFMGVCVSSWGGPTRMKVHKLQK